MLKEGTIVTFNANSGDGMVDIDGFKYYFTYHALSGGNYRVGERVRVQLREFHGCEYVHKLHPIDSGLLSRLTRPGSGVEDI